MSNTNDKAFLILTQISTYGFPVSIKVLGHDLRMPLSSLYRYISLLKDWNYIEENPITKEIFIGSTSLLLTKSYEKTKGESKEIEATLERLRDITGETSVYMVPAGYHALCVESRESHNALRCSFEIGQTQPLVKGATSKIILANLPSGRQRKVAQFYGVDIDSPKWVSEISKIKKDGFCISYSEYNEGVVGISVPVKHKKTVVGALSIMSPQRRTDGMTQLVLQNLLNEASILSGMD
ncbi:IclR family transcriptional regulator [Vibrio sp. HN007]|uniref:IclR family transcriptional regulator n=1 Tax=Vibrio iocasae TaxID=3098914 RepID=UPI0035D3F57B